ncbi:UPF0365 [Desulfonema limicola]|uniref:UPF0365 n=1 Tax=Desulfonema limicola TaxID=45656 RepID=A0A975BD32_9BACT|nr:flotillin-like FloA family protein [Desulfonema limicola]QTA83132.1 UPF0365 [Desulfonema limicola]
MENITIIKIIAVLLVIIGILTAVIIFLYKVKSLWLRAQLMGIRINPLKLLFMRMGRRDPSLFLELTIKSAQNNLDLDSKKIESLIASNTIEDARKIIDALALAKRSGIPDDFDFFQSFILEGGDIKVLMESKNLADKAGLEINLSDLSGHALSNGNIKQVVKSMSMAKKADLNLSFNHAAAIDMAGHDIFDAVLTAVQPKIIKTEPVTAITKNGIRMSASARITIETNLDHLIGGAGRETILSRAGESLIAAISSAESHNDILEHPESVSDKVWKEEMDEDTAFNILSLELTDIEIVENIGEKQRVQKAETDAKIARADAERKEHEVRIKIMETRARLMEEEIKIPSAMAQALSSGKLGITDYYKFKKLRTGMMDKDLSAKNLKNNEES